MTKRLEGMVAVITGASSGIGAGTVHRFVEEGASVVAADIQEEAGEARAAKLFSLELTSHKKSRLPQR